MTRRHPSARRPAVSQTDITEVDLDKGRVVMTLASTYNTLMKVIVECVQNAIDANAHYIWVAVDMKRRTIAVNDDGDGVSRDDFEEALRCIGHSVKKETKLGRFGLGLISPLDKCEAFSFTSQPAQFQTALRWDFRAKDIERQSRSITIPRTSIAGFRRRYIEEIGEEVQWRSQLIMRGITTDTTIAKMDPDSLQDFIQDKLGPALRKNNIVCRLTFADAGGNTDVRVVKPTDYTGEPLEVWSTDNPEVGQVEFTLYRAVRTSEGTRGKISVMEWEGNYPITWNEFVNQGSFDKLLSGEIVTALKSGFFEGVIRGEKLELHPQRNKFNYTDAVKGACFAIEEWWEDVGRDTYIDEQRLESEERYQRLALESMNRMSDLMRDPRFAALRQSLLDTVQIGTLGTGHNEPGAGKKNGPQGTGALRAGQGGAGTKRKPSELPTPDHPRNPTAPDRPGDVPFTAIGPNGKQRQLIRGDSLGLAICHFPLDEGSSRLWDFDPKFGVLHFNTRHPIWIKCDKKDNHIMQLQEWLIIELLTMLAQPEASQESVKDFIDAQLTTYVEFVILLGRTAVKK